MGRLVRTGLALLLAASAFAGQAAPSPLPGLLHRWTLDETAAPGVAADDAAGAKDAAYAPAGAGPGPSTSSLPPGLLFADPAALSFNGAQHLQVGGGLADVLGGTATLAFWIATTQASASPYLWESPGISGVELAGGGNDVFWGFLTNTGRIGLAVGDLDRAVSAAPVNDGGWHHVALTRSLAGGALQVYVDGTLSDAAPAGSTAAVTTPFASLGRIEDTSGTPAYFVGRLDDVRIYGRVLAEDEVRLLAQGYDGVTPSPGAPGNFQAVAGNGTVSLSWSAASGAVLGYRIYRSTSPITGFAEIGTSTQTSFTDPGAVNETTWHYYVVAYNQGGPGPASEVRSALPLAPARTEDHDEGLFGDRCACGAASGGVRSAAGLAVALALAIGAALARRPRD
jgi:hypothetical protein